MCRHIISEHCCNLWTLILDIWRPHYIKFQFNYIFSNVSNGKHSFSHFSSSSIIVVFIATYTISLNAHRIIGFKLDNVKSMSLCVYTRCCKILRLRRHTSCKFYEHDKGFLLINVQKSNFLKTSLLYYYVKNIQDRLLQNLYSVIYYNYIVLYIMLHT